MAVYKVIQDVEAEDKLLGPLTFKGFIYAGIALLCGYINFRLLFIGSPIKWVFIPVFLLPMLLFGVLASPLGREQPTEVWLLSKIKFFFKPRKRIWNQSGMEELVTITAPKKIEEHLTKDITQTEVQSRLKTLASTLDTRGWAIKNVDLNLNASTAGPVPQTVTPSDRLVANAGYNQPAEVIDVHAADDILDEQNNPTAQKFAALMQNADEERKRSVLKTMKGIIKDSSELGGPTEITKRLAKARSSFGKDHHKTKKQPAADPKMTQNAKPPEPTKPTPVTPERQAVNMELAQSGSAFSVSTLSQLANRQPKIEQTGPDEVTISLH
jgi:predicted outer membrane protein